MNKLFALLVLVTACNLQAQTLSLRVMAQLPSAIDESSGVEVSDRNSIWSHNDSGGKPELYQFDSTGTLMRTLGIQNAGNRDWEEITRDSDGNIYVGDFGNNSNNRTNLVIYKVMHPDIVSATSVTAPTINFTYPNQHAFPPSAALQNFDMEAMFWYNHSLYLFSKNRTSPYTGYTNLYRLPDSAGTYVATLVDSFYTGPGPVYNSWVTAADISPDGKTVALLSGNGILLFTNIAGDNFFGGNMQRLNFAASTQKEALVFISNNELYITEEGNIANLYYADLSSYIPAITGIDPLKKKTEIKLYPNPALNGQAQIQLAEGFIGSDLIIQNSKGQTVYSAVVTYNVMQLNMALPAGIYFISISGKQQNITRRIMVE